MSARMQDEADTVVGAESSGDLDSLLRVPSTRKPTSSVVPACVGHIVSIDAAGNIEVGYPGSRSALRARRVSDSPVGTPEPAPRVGQEVLLLFENGSPDLPIILGFVHPAPTVEVANAEPVEASDHDKQVIEADVDGKRLRIVAQDEIVLQCGNASITLRRNGRVVIRGTYVESFSEGTNRIKGGQVRIN